MDKMRLIVTLPVEVVDKLTAEAADSWMSRNMLITLILCDRYGIGGIRT